MNEKISLMALMTVVNDSIYDISNDSFNNTLMKHFARAWYPVLNLNINRMHCQSVSLLQC